MSKNNQIRNITSTLTDNHSYRVIFIRVKYPLYWDEGYDSHHSKEQRHKMTRNWKKREVTHVQYRMYRTWKHNRSNQWKD